MPLGHVDVASSEGDVETQIILPLLTSSELLGIDLLNIKSKKYLPAFDIGKGSKSRKGYVPDFTVNLLSLPMVVVEAKAPIVPITDAWEESTLYAHAINKKFRAQINPCKLILATNGFDFAAGKWDQEMPEIQGKVSDIVVGSETLAKLQALMGNGELERTASIDSAALKLTNFRRPFNQGEGPALISSKVESNTFAADLAPILRRYFSSRAQNRDPEIYRNAYVSSNEITSYDKILESFLVDRLSRSKSRLEVVTTKRRAEVVSSELTNIISSMSANGELQLVTGGVGVGKSLFARRYKELLQPAELLNSSHWAFIDFNLAPDDITQASEWVAGAFVGSLFEEGAPLNIRDATDQERIFAANLADREAYYQRVEKIERGKGELERARDLEGWRQDPLTLAKGVSRHLQGDKGDVIIAVFDNVDRRDVTSQLAAFQLAMWFMDQVRCLVLLQMRDTTFEAYKDQKPLDTYKTGKIFHISPPRFIDVVKRRLELSLEELEKQAPKTIQYTLSTGMKVSYSSERAGEFIKSIYIELFQRPTNVSRILEALAGRNVRKALDMFLAIITSGHMPEDLIASIASGNNLRRFPEYRIIRILMREDYRFFSENSAIVANLFYTSNSWVRPNNFLVSEILFFLISQRKRAGDNGQMGFVAVERLKLHLEQLGYVREDIHSGAQYLLSKELIEADSAAAKLLEENACIKASASGWAHMRILSSRVEYLSAVLPTTPLNDPSLDARIFGLMQTENRFGKIGRFQSLGIVENFKNYLEQQLELLAVHPGYVASNHDGARYILRKISEAIAFEKSDKAAAPSQIDWLDG